MEDVDRMIMYTLSRLQCSFTETHETLGILRPEHIIEAIVRLLWAVNPKYKDEIDSFKLPQHMTLKYKFATMIASAVTALGIRQDVGYQTLLYPNVFDIRQIFMFLIEKLPKETSVEDADKTPVDLLRERIAEQIRTDPNKSANEGDSKNPTSQSVKISFTTNGEDRRTLICELIAGVPVLNFDLESVIPGLKYISLDSKARIKSATKTTALWDDEERKRDEPIQMPIQKPKVPKKPKLAQKKEPATAAHRDKLLEQNKELGQKIRAKMEQLKEIEEKRQNTVKKTEEAQLVVQNHDEKLIQVLADPQKQFNTMNTFITGAESRRNELEEKFLELKAENDKKLETLQEARGVAQQSQTVEYANAESRLVELISQRRGVVHKMRKQLNRIEENEDQRDGASERAQYVDRIMYLVKNVAQQKKEIVKNFAACKALEKERNNLDGVLDRTFTVVKRWLMGRGDPTLEAAWNSASKMHSHCAQIVGLLDEIHSINSNTDELGDKIELLRQHSAENASTQILNDLAQIRAENEKLRREIAAKV